MKRTRFSLISLLLLAGCLLFSCKRDPFDVNVKGIRAPEEILRLEVDLFEAGPDGLAARVPELKEQYGSFLQLFSYVIYAGDTASPAFPVYLNQFVTEKTNHEVYQACMKAFPDLSSFGDDLLEGWKYYQYYFPEKEVPSLYTYISGFNNSLIIGNRELGVGLDRYLGAESPYYKQLGLYSYQIQKMQASCIPRDCFYGWAQTEWPFGEGEEPALENVLNKMLYEAKLLYFTQAMLPEVEETILFGFDEKQLAFCRANEEFMWMHLIENDLLYATDRLTVNKLIGEGPFTHYFSRESPARAAIWLGYRIIASYMRENPEVSLAALMENADYQSILNASGYQAGR